MTTNSYKALLAQREALEQQIAAARKSEVSGAVQEIKALIEAFGLTPDDVFPPAKQKREASSVALNTAIQLRAKHGLAEESRRTGSRIKTVRSLRFKSGPSGPFFFMETFTTDGLSATPFLVHH